MKLQLFDVSPSIPGELCFLETLSCNMWWCWNSEAVELFRRMDPKLWGESGHNPRRLLSLVPQSRLKALTADEGFRQHLREVQAHFDRSIVAANEHTGRQRTDGNIAYFSLEYGIHESVRNYSGGLGVLAGDHLKAASDLQLPLVGVGLQYRQGYFQQYLTSDGMQQERYPEHEIQHLPVQRAVDAAGQQIQICLPLPSGSLHAIVWRVDVGSIPLFLLDANIPDNPPELRTVTAQLYAGDRELRLRQELLLGIGGFHALLAMGLDPHACHINEGHAAFLSLARIAHLVKDLGIDMEAAREIVARSNVFTTHTPVPAGNETFHVDLVRPHLRALEPLTGIHADDIIAWGQAPIDGHRHELSMTILGLRLSHHCNAVSQLHGEVARKMWAHLWPGRPEDEIGITHVTNGVHVPSWLSPDNKGLFDRYIGPAWRDKPGAPTVLKGLGQIPDEELWRAHELARSRLIRTVRELSERQLQARNATRTEIAQAKSVLDHDALTIGFARRFTTYKRAALLLRDQGRLMSLLTNEDRPVQIVFAGKAHPADESGKALIREIVHFARRPEVRRHVVFLENYDINVARSMVQGVDIWLNTPRRPHEASGTSGMKACINGAIHVSVLDGWWCEGYSRQCGWAIGNGEEYADVEYQDAVEAQALYNLLENEVVPTFYDRATGDLPHDWISMMKASMRMSLKFFTSHRMMAEYQRLFYEDAVTNYAALTADNGLKAKELVTQRKRFESLWSHIKAHTPYSEESTTTLHVGDTFKVTALVALGELKPDEVDVEVYYGKVDSQNRVRTTHVVTMDLVEQQADGNSLFEHEITCQAAGRYGFTTRVTPHGAYWRHLMPGFITWAEGS